MLEGVLVIFGSDSLAVFVFLDVQMFGFLVVPFVIDVIC